MSDGKAYVYRIPTGYAGYTLEQLWEIVRHETGATSEVQYDAWRRMAQICNDQADQLDAAVARLAEHWPAHPGSASEAFGLWIRSLTDSMRRSAAGALDARQAIMSITTQLSVARGEIAGLMGDRSRYERDEQLMVPQPTPSPGETPRPVATSAPPDGWRQMLTERARQTMAAADKAVTTYAGSLPNMAVDVGRIHVSDPFDPVPSTGGGSGSMRLPYIPMPPLPSPPVVSSGDVVLPDPRDAPVLSGGPAPPLPAANLGSTPPPAPSQSTPPTPHVPLGVLPVGTIGPSGHVRGPAGVSAPLPGRAGTPGHGAAPAGSPPSTGAGAGKAGPGAHAAGMMPMAPIVPPAGGGGSGGARAVPGGRSVTPGMRRRRNDPDDPWAVKEGAPAVLEPAAEPASFDPGPGVIGLDR
jgi:hypothetical protein